MLAMPFVTRFAPSPTGHLHRGHAFSALTAWRSAQAVGGRFIVRIEDIDAARCAPAFEASILEDLAWLGLAWERPVRRQSEHLADYQALLGQLIVRGLAYRCFRTRKEVLDEIGRAPHGPGEGASGRTFRGGPLPAAEEAERLAAGQAFAWRLSLSAAQADLGDAAWSALSFVEEGLGPAGEHGRIAVRPERAGDIVLARKDVGVAYHLAVVVDDALQGVTHVIRGEDLHEAAHIQRLLQALLLLPEPIYRHHRMLMAPSGARLAKRDRAETLRDLRSRGVSAEALIAGLGLPGPP